MKTSVSTAAGASGGLNRRESLFVLCSAALGLSGCGGGGGGVAGVSSGGTGFSAGPITGIGSIIVNGIRFDDSAARISDDDGAAVARSHLKLGMRVRVRSRNVSGTSGVADAIEVGSDLKGRISSIDTATQSFVVLGQTVQVTGSTMFEATLTSGLASLAVGDVVEVHGVVNFANNTLQATFIERETNATAFKIEGKISNLDPATQQFSIGTLRIGYGSIPANELGVTPTNGALVRVRLVAVLPPNPEPAVWTATRIRPPEDALEDRDTAEVEGDITSLTTTRSFSVNGVAVDASGASFPRGEAGVVLGARVEVHGRLSGGVLIATRVTLEDENEVNHLEFELHGTVSNLTASSFTLTSSGGIAVSVSFGTTTTFDPGTSAGNLANGRRVEVRGTASATGTTIVASRIHFES